MTRKEREMDGQGMLDEFMQSRPGWSRVVEAGDVRWDGPSGLWAAFEMNRYVTDGEQWYEYDTEVPVWTLWLDIPGEDEPETFDFAEDFAGFTMMVMASERMIASESYTEGVERFLATARG